MKAAVLAIAFALFVGALVKPATGLANDFGDAVTTGDASKVKALIDGGANPKQKISFSHNNFAGGKTVKRDSLMVASVFGHADVAKVLVDAGVKSKYAICPAAVFGNTEVVEILIAAGANLNVKCFGTPKRKPADAAAAAGQSGTETLIRNAGG